MSAAFSVQLPGAEPVPGEYRIKWTCDASGNWVRDVRFRSGNAEFVLHKLPDLTIPATERTECK